MAIIKSPAWIALMWFGMTAGISLLATSNPLATIFRASVVTLDTEHSVLMALNKAEFVALIVLLILVRVSARARELLLPSILVSLVLIIQATWLLPALGSHTGSTLSGVAAGGISANTIYSFLELSKLFLLAYLGLKSLQILTISNQLRE